MKHRILILIGSLAVLAAGCASNQVPDPEVTADTGTAESDASSRGYDGSNLDRGQSLNDDSDFQLATVVYFDYDQAELSREYIDLLAKHAARLSGGGQIEIRLEGHADERGSREYNVGLGERRSQTVRRILEANGVSNSQISTVSFGEERPAVTGGSEQSYAMNRRVELNYVK